MKPLNADLAAIAATKQVRDYLNHYGQVFLTNYRAFQLLWRDAAGNQHDGERFVLAGSESDFWQLAAHPRKAATQYGERLADYLQRMMPCRPNLDIWLNDTTPECSRGRVGLTLGGYQVLKKWLSYRARVVFARSCSEV